MAPFTSILNRRQGGPAPCDETQTSTTNDTPDRAGRSTRRRPFSALMKKLANLKAASTGDGGRSPGSKRSGSKKQPNNPYPQSGRIEARHSHYSISTGPSRRLTSVASLDRGELVRLSGDELQPPTTAGRSGSTEHEGYRSIMGGSSLAGTSRTANGRRGGDSTFSSPAPSVRSLTTTLTTIQTVPPTAGGNHHSTLPHHTHSNSQAIQFNQPFPTAPPASAIPAHVTGTNPHPTTYATATANNLLTDNASILTLASSSKRRRRRSFDTDASVRAMAPSSLWGGSRESLPLSVLSATLDGPTPTTPGLHRGASAGLSGMGNERTSIYSANGIIASERNSFYAKQGFGGVGGDAASVRSGLLGHGRAESVSGSIGGLGVPAGTSPLASPREVSEKGEDEGVAVSDEKEEREKEKA